MEHTTRREPADGSTQTSKPTAAATQSYEQVNSHIHESRIKLIQTDRVERKGASEIDRRSRPAMATIYPGKADRDGGAFQPAPDPGQRNRADATRTPGSNTQSSVQGRPGGHFESVPRHGRARRRGYGIRRIDTTFRGKRETTVDVPTVRVTTQANGWKRRGNHREREDPSTAEGKRNRERKRFPPSTLNRKATTSRGGRRAHTNGPNNEGIGLFTSNAGLRSTSSHIRTSAG